MPTCDTEALAKAEAISGACKRGQSFNAEGHRKNLGFWILDFGFWIKANGRS
jgi:hypothetical protein